MIFFNMKFMRIVLSYKNGQNLHGRTFAQFGGNHMRNIMTGAQTIKYFLVCALFLMLENMLIIAFRLYPDIFDARLRFIFHNTLWILFLDVFFGLYVPIRHILLSRNALPSLWLVLDENPKLTTNFYVHDVRLSPRRYLKGTRRRASHNNQYAVAGPSRITQHYHHNHAIDTLCPISID